MSSEQVADTENTVTQTAGDKSRVDNMVGVIHGDAQFYSVSSDSTPERKYEVGKRYLAGGVPREAEPLLREAAMSEHAPADSAFYWVLAILSRRTLDELTDHELDHLDTAWGQSKSEDACRVMVDVVHRLVFSQLEQSRSRFNAALHDLQELPDEQEEQKKQKAEVRRHLDLILTGGEQDQVAAQDAADVARLRMDNKRAQRATLFFEESPERPRQLPTTEADLTAERLSLVVGVLFAILGLYIAGQSLPPTATSTLAGALAGCCAAGLLLVHLGFGILTARAGRHLQRARLAGRPACPPAPGPRSRHRKWDELTERIDDIVEESFDKRSPKDKQGAKRWRVDTTGIRATLKREIADQYAEGIPPKAEAIEWLARWHAGQIKDRWPELDTSPARPETPPARLAGMIVTAGVMAAALTILGVAAWQSASTGGALAVALCLGAVVIGGGGGTGLARDAARRAAENAYHEQRLRDEMDRFERWTAELRKQPDDAEMAGWLDHDKAYIRAIAMREFGLSDREIIARAVVTGPNLNTRRVAWVAHGPLRYSVYDVELFLLTDNGVRQFTVHLNMTNGDVGRERSASFRYDAVTSAESDGLTLRLRAAVERTVDAVADDEDAAERLALARSFKVMLNNAVPVAPQFTGVDTDLMNRDDRDAILQLARDTSGVTAAARILIAIAAEGKDWVRLEKRRRQRRLQCYRNRRAAGEPPLGQQDVAVAGS